MNPPNVSFSHNFFHTNISYIPQWHLALSTGGENQTMVAEKHKSFSSTTFEQ